jgi:hypothetical protein
MTESGGRRDSEPALKNPCCFKALSFVSNGSGFGRIVKTNLLLNRFRLTLIIGCILFIAADTLSFAETLPAPSRSVYKCSANGVTSYSDAPCLGAKRIEIEPTRGVGKKEGYDIQRERYREMFAEAVRPLTGMDGKQLDIQGRRMKLSAHAQHECRALDAEIPGAERGEAGASREQLEVIKTSLFNLRRRQRELRC